MKMEKTKALIDLCPGARFNIMNDDLSTLEWLEDDPRPTDEEIIAHIEVMKVREATEAYKIIRKNNYPDIGDQLDDLFHSGAFSPEMTAKIQAIKDKYPKGN